jgi:hypothetical protein
MPSGFFISAFCIFFVSEINPVSSPGVICAAVVNHPAQTERTAMTILQ